MFDVQAIGKVIGPEAVAAINASNLPKSETMTLLQVWTHSSRAKLRDLARAGELLPVLKRDYRTGLEQANEVRLNNSHLTPTECLQSAGLPLTL